MQYATTAVPYVQYMAYTATAVPDIYGVYCNCSSLCLWRTVYTATAVNYVRICNILQLQLTTYMAYTATKVGFSPCPTFPERTGTQVNKEAYTGGLLHRLGGGRGVTFQPCLMYHLPVCISILTQT